MTMLKRAYWLTSIAIATYFAAPPTFAKVTAEVCVSAQQAGIRVYEAALANKRLYPTDADARAVANATFTRMVLAENIYKTEYTGTGRGPGEYQEAVELCRRAKAPYIAEAAGLFAELTTKAVRGPATKK